MSSNPTMVARCVICGCTYERPTVQMIEQYTCSEEHRLILERLDGDGLGFQLTHCNRCHRELQPGEPLDGVYAWQCCATCEEVADGVA